MPCLSPGSSVMSIALVRVAEVPMQECFKRRERPADARFPFVDDLFGLVEFQQPDMGEPRRQKNVRRIACHAAPGDPVLHDVHGTGDGAEDARRVVCGDSFSPNSVVPYCLMVMAIRSTKSPSPSLFSFGFFLAECRR